MHPTVDSTSNAELKETIKAAILESSPLYILGKKIRRLINLFLLICLLYGLLAILVTLAR